MSTPKPNPFRLYKPLWYGKNPELIQQARQMLNNYQNTYNAYGRFKEYLNPDGTRRLTDKKVPNKVTFKSSEETKARNALKDLRKIVEQIDEEDLNYLTNNQYTRADKINWNWDTFDNDINNDMFPDFDDFDELSDPNAPNPWMRRIASIRYMNDDYVNKRLKGKYNEHPYKLEKHGDKFVHITPDDPNNMKQEESISNTQTSTVKDSATGAVDKVNELENKPTDASIPEADIQPTKIPLDGNGDKIKIKDNENNEDVMIKASSYTNKYARYINGIQKAINNEYDRFNQHASKHGNQQYKYKEFDDIIKDYVDYIGKDESISKDEKTKLEDIYYAFAAKYAGYDTSDDPDDKAEFSKYYNKIEKDSDAKAVYDALLDQSTKFKYPINPANPENVAIKKEGKKEITLPPGSSYSTQPVQQYKTNQQDISSQQPVLVPQYSSPTNIHNLLSYDYALTSNAEYMRKRIQEANNKMFPRRTPNDVKKMLKLRIDNNKNVALKGGMPLSAFF